MSLQAFSGDLLNFVVKRKSFHIVVCFPFSQKQPSLTPINTQSVECLWLGLSNRHGTLTCWPSLNIIIWKCSQTRAEFSTLEKMLLPLSMVNNWRTTKVDHI